MSQARHSKAAFFKALISADWVSNLFHFFLSFGWACSVSRMLLMSEFFFKDLAKLA